MGQSEIAIMTPFTFICPRCRNDNHMEIEATDKWIQVARWAQDGRCWWCAYQFDPLEVMAAFESAEKRSRQAILDSNVPVRVSASVAD